MLDHRDGHGQDGATDGTGQAASVAAQGLAAVTDPVCGMTVDPAVVTAEAAPNRELADMTRRF